MDRPTIHHYILSIHSEPKTNLLALGILSTDRSSNGRIVQWIFKCLKCLTLNPNTQPPYCIIIGTLMNLYSINGWSTLFHYKSTTLSPTFPTFQSPTHRCVNSSGLQNMWGMCMDSRDRPWSSGLHDRQTPLLYPYFYAYMFFHYEFTFHLKWRNVNHASLS